MQTEVIVLAHRGATGAARENTVEAFAAAVELGVGGIELDVRRTGDGALVVHHDAVLPSLGPLSNLRVRDLPDWLPLLADALDACHGVLVNVEVKNLPTEPGWDPTESIAADVAAVVAERRMREAVVVSSFTLATVDAARAADPGLRTGWLTLPGYDQLDALATAAERGHAALHPHDEAVTEELVAAAHRAGLAVTTWTVDEPARMTELAGWGVDGLVTNVPALALDVLGQGRSRSRQSGS